MNADRIPYEPPSARDVAQVRDATERKKKTENARDETSHRKPATNEVGVE